MVKPERTFEDLVAQARDAYYHLRLAEAEEHYRAAARSQPRSYEAHLGLARTLTRIRREEEAQAEVNQCISLQPDRPEAYATLGILHFLADRNQEAVSMLVKAISLDASDPEPHLTLSQAYADLHEFERSEQELSTARELIHNIADEVDRQEMLALAWHVETYRYLAQGQQVKAMEAAQEVLALGEANPYAACLAYSNLGILEARAGRAHYDRAIEYLERAYQMNPFFHRAGSALGRLLIVRGQPQRAVEVLSKVMESLPTERGGTRYVYAVALAKSGRRAEALEQYRQALTEGLSGPDRLLAHWQSIWLGVWGRRIVIGVVLVALLLWVLLARPSPQTLTLLLLVAVILTLQRVIGRRNR